jgi:hypothetical protein
MTSLKGFIKTSVSEGRRNQKLGEQNRNSFLVLASAQKTIIMTPENLFPQRLAIANPTPFL